ncbi:GNAT family N-acetyltransferase [Micromonospora sp. WMMA1363]|uniref:GNAT family N-acetyltransferase n=1 Tax=Micromonospora sp. WMMA1363 TaxID=3053985 RepID=UPI00259D0084|nr:GNAT family N-acetyltransferase [Micromonospora sp. WMMA1363]MDM4722559.1 GNAT family N-acetyltransferase [Micromonospora sp. WMMA1363]
MDRTGGVPVIVEVRPDLDEALARSLLAVQRAAYALEAALIGDDRIPPLHETLADLRAASLHWLAAFTRQPAGGDAAGRADVRPVLVGAIAWAEDGTTLDIDRLVVDPAAHRRGVGRALVGAALTRAGARRVLVATGRTNEPARRLYESLNFTSLGDEEVIPHLWITRYARPA